MAKEKNPNKKMNKWQITSYGLGSAAQNFGCLLVNYGMLFMTDYVGMNAGIVATLIAVSKIFDAVTDIIAGTIIDRTRHKMGRGRVWLIRMAPLMLLASIAFFYIPVGASDAVKYVYFFITYTLFSDIFYTMLNVAHQSMPLFSTDQADERTSLSVVNFMGNIVAATTVTASYLGLIAAFGGGVEGWRKLAILFGLVFFVLQLIYGFSIREMPREDAQKTGEHQPFLKELLKNIGYLFQNPYFIMQLFVMMIYTLCFASFSQVAAYYCIRVLGDTNNAAGTQTWLSLTSMGIIIGLLFSAPLQKKFGLYKTNFLTRVVACLCYILTIVGGMTHTFILILIGEFLFYGFQGPYLGTVGVLLGEICNYSKLKNGVELEATVASCNSFGTKVGNALGVACVGWMLAAVHYDGTLAVQPQSSLNMITFIFLFFPIICQIIIAILMGLMDVEKANKRLAEKAGQQ